MIECISCNEKTSEAIKFPCPKCKKAIFRCEKCRNLSIGYKCKCGFEGP